MLYHLKDVPCVLGFTGYSGVGKDAIAREMEKDGWLCVAFADALKQELIRIDLGYTVPFVDPMELLEATKRSAEGHTRTKLQELGQFVREIDPDYWLNRAVKDVMGVFNKAPKTYKGIIFTDVRYVNEVDMVQEHGKLVSIQRKGHGPINEHLTESIQVYLNEQADIVVHNNGTIEDAVRDLVWDI